MLLGCSDDEKVPIEIIHFKEVNILDQHTIEKILTEVDLINRNYSELRELVNKKGLETHFNAVFGSEEHCRNLFQLPAARIKKHIEDATETG